MSAPGQSFGGAHLRSQTLIHVPLSAEVTPEVATFAGGCFWGVEHIFLKHYPPSQNKGILKTAVGYTGGNTNDPNYQEVCSGSTDHAEALRIEFNPNVVSYAELVGERPITFISRPSE